MSVQELHVSRPTDPHPAQDVEGILPDRGLRDAERLGWISSGDFKILPENVQPASLDLRLGEVAWRLRSSFLPDSESTLGERIDDLAFDKVDIRQGAILEPNRPYLVQLIEELALPDDIRGKANPKSSTGRLDVFTRVITEGSSRFDEIRAGYVGKLYLEIVPRSFAVKVKTRLSLNQLRLAAGHARVSDRELPAVHRKSPLLYLDGAQVAEEDLAIADGLFLSVNLARNDRPVGYRAKKNTNPLDLSEVRGYHWREYWEPVFPDPGKSRIVLEPEDFYLLLSAEGVCVPPDYAAEMTAYDPTAGELRTHYAGFFDPGFGYDPLGESHGTRAALEVRARDVAFMVEHRQPICKLAYERMREQPERLYGDDVGSHYQGQDTMLSKHFVEPDDASLRLFRDS